MKITVLGIDLAKSVFQLHGNDACGKAVLRKKLRRSELAAFIAQIPPCLIAMEACGSSQFWARKFQELGHEVRLIAPQFVKPFVKTNKNDAADAEAIAEAAVRPNMRFVPIKEKWQQEVLALHRARSLIVKHRVAVSNEIRGFLSEQGLVFATGDTSLKKGLHELFSLDQASFSSMFLNLLRGLWNQMQSLLEQQRLLDQEIERIGKADERCLRLQKIEGIGPITATALVASVGNAQNFKNGRQLSAFLGLVPKQHSSGGSSKLLGISKRGDGYLRKLLIHGARAAIQFASKRDTRRSHWVVKKVESRGMNKATVAFANRNARIAWAILSRGEEYNAAA